MVACWFDQQRVAQPDPNHHVGGPLLTIVVVTAAWLTVGATALFYLFALDPNKPSRETDQVDNDDDSINYIDAATSRLGAHLRQKCPLIRWLSLKGGPERGPLFAKSILAMCDVQTLIGISLLITGLLDLSSGISAYHFMLVVRTAWFAHIAQLSALSMVRHAIPKHPVLNKSLRVLPTFVLAALFIAATVPTLSFNWAYASGRSASLPGSNAICFFDILRSVDWHYQSSGWYSSFFDSPAFGWGIAAVVLLSVNSLLRIVRVLCWFDRAALRARRGVGKGWVSLFADAAESDSPYMKVAVHVGVATMLTARLHSDLLVSALSSVYWLVIPAVWGTITLLFSTFQPQVNVPTSSWTLGQVLPTILILAVLIMTIGKFYLSSKTPDLPTVEPQPKPTHRCYSDASTNTTTTDETSLPPTTHTNTDPSPSPDIPLLSRDYSNPHTTPWLAPAVSLIALNLASLTILFFLDMLHTSVDIGTMLLFFLRPVLVGIPLSTYGFVLLCLGWEALVRAKGGSFLRKYGVGAGVGGYVYWVGMGVVWAATGGLYLLLWLVGKWGALRVVNIIIMVVGGGVVVGNVLVVVALVVEGWKGRGRGAIAL